MKVLEILFEAVDYDKYEKYADKAYKEKWRPGAVARIYLSGTPDAPGGLNIKGLNPEAVAMAYEEAMDKFEKVKAASKTKLQFKTIPEAVEELKKMEYPGWPIGIHIKDGHGRYDNKTMYRKEKLVVKKLDFKEPEFKGLEIEDLGDGKFKVHTTEKNSQMNSLIKSIAYAAVRHKLEVRSKSGLDVSKRLGVFKADAVIIKGDRKKIDEIIADVKNDHADSAWEKHDKMNNEPENRIARNKANAAQAKDRKAELDAKYGKGITDRVKIKQLLSDGDDGYQWSLWVDGKRTKSGMTRYQAEYEQRYAWAYLSKLEKMSPEDRVEYIEDKKNLKAGLDAYFMLDFLEKDAKRAIAVIAKRTKDEHKAKQEYDALLARLKKAGKD